MNKIFQGLRYLIFFILFFYLNSSGAVRFWVATGPANWSSNNWATASGGPPGWTVNPGDDVVFDGNGTGNCTVDVNVNVNSITINPGFTGTIIQGNVKIRVGTGGATLMGGSFLGSNGPADSIIVVGPLIIDGTNFTSTRGVLNPRRSFTINSGSFNHNNGIIKYTDSLTIDGSHTVYKLIFTNNKLYMQQYRLTPSTVITVLGALQNEGIREVALKGGRIDLHGDLIQKNGYNPLNTPQGTTAIHVIGSGNQTFYGFNNYGYGPFPYLTIDKPSGSIILNRIMNISGGWNYIQGNITGNGWLSFVGATSISGTNSYTKLNLYATGPSIFGIDPATTLTITDSFRVSGGGNWVINNSTVFVTGDIISANFQFGGGGSGRIVINGTTDQYLVGNDRTAFPDIVIDKPSGLLYMVGDVVIRDNWIYRQGTITGTGTLNLLSGNRLIGSHTLPRLAFRPLNITFPFVVRTGTVITVDTLLKISQRPLTAPEIFIDSGDIHVKGDIYIDNGYFGGGGNATITVNGTRDQTITVNTFNGMGRLPNFIIDKPAGNLTIIDTLSVAGHWEYRRGNVTAPPNVVLFGYNKIIDAQGITTNLPFNHLLLGDAWTRKLQSDVTVISQLNLKDGKINLNGFNLHIMNNSPMGMIRKSGLVLSETDPTVGYSYVNWHIGNGVSGASYLIPFGSLDYDTIPFVYTVTAAGISGGNGVLQAATYPTDVTQLPNNRPLPAGVTNLNNIIGADHAQKFVDRYWIINFNNYTTPPDGSGVFTYEDDQWIPGNNSIIEANLQGEKWNPVTQSWDPPVGSVDTMNNTVWVPSINESSIWAVVDPTLPEVEIAVSDTLICQNNCVNFYDSNLVTPLAWQWSFPGATPNSSSQQHPTNICYPAPGSYDVTLVITYPNGTLSKTFTNYITVKPGPTANTGPDAMICPGGSTTLSASGGTSFIWHPGDGLSDSTIANPVASPSTTTRYIVEVFDNFGCSDTASVLVTVAAPPQANAGPDDSICSGGSTTLTAAGGVAYSWSPASSLSNPNSATTQASPLTTTTYTVTVTDANGCTATDDVTITVLPAPVANAGPDVTICKGQSTQLSASGGVSYTWSPATGLSATNIPDPVASPQSTTTYSVTVTDANGCTATDDVTVTVPNPMTLTTQIVSPISCFGANDGVARVDVAGGVPLFNYDWGGGRVVTGTVVRNNVQSGLSPGTYIITVTDGNNCPAYDTITLTEPAQLNVNIIQSNDVLCFGGNDGSSIAEANGGTPPYVYTWSNAVTSGPVSLTRDTNNVLSAGNHQVTVTDANGCTAQASFTIDQPAAPLSVNLSKTDVSCNGYADGEITANVSGGTPPYSYNWSGGTPSGNQIINLTAGFYKVTVTDNNGCTVIDSLEILEPTAIQIQLSVGDVRCFGGADGYIAAQVSGGTPGYVFNWSGGTPNATGDTTKNLPAGTYSLTVNDNHLCTATASATVNQPASPLQVSLQAIDVTCFGNADGKVIADPSGGTPPYTFNWSGGVPVPTGDTIVDLIAGNYTVTVTDNNGCTVTGSIAVSGPAASLSTVVTVKDVSCFNGNDGWATVDASGGTPPYAYQWSAGTPGINGDTTFGLPSGIFYLTTTDNHGCSRTDTFYIGQPAAPLAVTFIRNDVQCHGGNDGWIAAIVSGGTSPYTYNWSGGVAVPTGDTIINLSAGIYTLTLTDAAGCQLVKTDTVKQPSQPLGVSISATDVSCYGNADGMAIADVSGGTQPYSYQWSGGVPGIPGDTVRALTAGTYSLTVTDNKGCTVTSSVVINQPAAPLSDSLQVKHVSCYNQNDGMAIVIASGGTAPYSYNWSAGTPAPTGDTVKNLIAGQYYLTITDARNCTLIDTFTITQPQSALSVNVTTVDVTCYGFSDGMAIANVSGGTPPYTYQWSAGVPGLTPDTVKQLAAGVYTLDVIDQNNCTATDSFNVNQPPPITVNYTIKNVSCHGGNDGQIIADASGGTPPYQFQWSGGVPNISGDTLSQLSASIYYLTIIDNNGCQFADSIAIQEPSALAIALNVGHVNCFGGNDGEISASVSGGTAPYTFNWSGGTPVPTGDTIENLVAGKYYLTITDAAGCTAIDSAVVDEPATPLTDSLTIRDVRCFGGNDGQVIATVNGGTPPYSFSWSAGIPSASGDTVSMLQAGDVYVTITDSRSCSIVDTAVISQPGSAVSVSIGKKDVSCFNGNDGWAAAIATGGTPGYTYQWSGGTPNPTGDTIRQLTAGLYYLTVTDSGGCSLTDSIRIDEPPALTVALSVRDISCNGAADGMIAAQVSGGVAPYTYTWSGGTPNVTGDTIRNLSSSVYSLTVTDANGCSVVKSDSVMEPAPVDLTVTLDSAVSCAGASDGVATVSVNGGTAPFDYQWQGFTPVTGSPDRTHTISGLQAGLTKITVTDANGCMAVDSVMVTQPEPLVLTLTVDQHVTCNGASDGRATAIVSGGTGPYVYSWPGHTTPATTDTFNTYSQLAAGAFDITVTDANGCQAVENLIITEPPLMALNLSITTPISCNGMSDGVIRVDVNNGVPPYTYQWSSGRTSSSQQPFDENTGIAAGMHSVTVTDSSGCTAADTIMVNDPAPVVVGVSMANSVSCFNGNDGSAIATVSGGTPPFDYLWSNGQNVTGSTATSNTQSGLSAGNYTVTVSDANGCSGSASVTITQPDSLIVDIIVIRDVSCFGFSDGVLQAVVTGGTGPFDFEWSTGTVIADHTGNTVTEEGLPSGLYSLTVVDDNGCSFTESQMVTQPDSLWVVVHPAQSEIVLGESVELSTSHNAVNPVFQWEPPSWLDCADCANPVASPVFSTVYTVSLTDENGCVAAANAEIIIKEEKVLYVPNAFSPNGDDKNDIFRVYTKGTQFAHLVITNRWGEVLFETHDINEGWDGTYKGSEMPPGVYVWYLYLEYIDKTAVKQTGSLTLIK